MVLARWDGILGLAGKNLKNVKRWKEIFTEPALGLSRTAVVRGLGLNVLWDQQSAMS